MAGLNSVPSGERIHIGFFGLRNAGKSSLVNAVTGQDLAVVSDVRGTTTDLVSKAMELLPIGPVVIVDTPGIDDEGDLGVMRVERARQALRKCDIAVLVTQAGLDLQPAEEELLDLFQQRGIPFAIALNKVDLLESCQAELLDAKENCLAVSATDGTNINAFKEMLGHLSGSTRKEKRLVADLLEPGDIVVLVIPIDSSAPKGRLILPQQMVMRDVLDNQGICIACQPSELADLLGKVNPRIVITDSQAFGRVADIVSPDVLLTSFSILMARYKGELRPFVQGSLALSHLKDGDKVVISEGCSHHRQCEDIGTVKMPAWIRSYSGANPEFIFTSGGTFPDDLSDVQLIVHCGGCMLNDKEMGYRTKLAQSSGVPIVNYGIAIAAMHGILARSLQVFPSMDGLLNGLAE